MIEKKISYNINIEKPSTTKPVKQGGVLNYLGKQKTVNAPVRWRSSKDHPIAKLAYITKDEEKILIDLNLYGSLKGKPNRGPSGIMSLQGSGSGSGGDGGSSGGDSGGDSGQGDSGPGGSDDGSSSGVGSGEGESTGDANDQGGTEGPGPGSGVDDGGYSGFGIGPNAEAEAAASNAAAAAQANALAQTLEDQANREQNPATARLSPLGVTAYNMSLTNPEKSFAEKAMGFVTSPFSTALATAYDSYARGATGPSDDTQEQSSVQTSTPSAPDGGGGITTIQSYAPLYNTSTGSNTADALLAMYRSNLKLR